MANIHKKVLNAVATGTSETIDTKGMWPVTMMVEFGASTSAGVVTFEASGSPAYGGTWKSIGLATWAVATSMVSVSAAQDAFRYVRARISTAIVGGTVNVWITASTVGQESWDQSP